MLQYQPKLYQICPSAYGVDWWRGGGITEKYRPSCYFLNGYSRKFCDMNIPCVSGKLKMPNFEALNNYNFTILPAIELIFTPLDFS